MKNFSQPGDTITVTAPAAVTSGDPVLVNALFGIAQFSADNGAEVEIKRTGVFTGVPKATGAAWAVGEALYWNSSNSNFTKSSSGNTLVGAVAAAAGSSDATGTVLLTGQVA